MNETPTCTESDAGMTQVRSLDVREWLGATREQVELGSPIWWCCTNLLEALERFQKETDPSCLKNIAFSIGRWSADLERRLDH